jgi:endo-1,4-beta-xylanase
MSIASQVLLMAATLVIRPPGLTAQTLREEAADRKFLVGTAVRPSLFTEARYVETLAREFNMVEPEDALKWWVLHPEREVYDFRQADQVVTFAEIHHMKVRGHTLVWGWTNPDWLTKLQAGPAERSELLHQHINRVVTHFRGQVFAWDVVNEGFDEHGKLRASIWYDQPGIGLAGKGTAYIEQSLRWAHEADPQAKLFYNDGGAETLNAKSDAVYEMVRDFRRRGVPIDGIGLQMHIFDLNPDVEGIRKNIARFAALGVEVHITELDVALPVGPGGNASAEDLAKQAEIYQRIASACLQTRGCTALQMWGFTDKWSWVGSATKHTKGAAMIFDRNYAPKLAYGALRDALAAKPVPSSRAASP